MKRSRVSRLPALSLSNGLACFLANVMAIAVFISPTVVFSQNPEWLNFTSTNSGLPDNNITALVADNLQNIWIGTVNGLAEFDGVSWTVYNKDNSGLPDNNITALVADNRQNIWIGTYSQGLARLSKDTEKKWTIYNKNNSGLQNNWIQVLAVDSRNNVWIGTHHQGLAKLENDEEGSWVIYMEDNSGLPCDRVSALLVDNQENIWVGTWNAAWPNNGLARLNENAEDAGKRWTVYNKDNSGLSCNNINVLAVDASGNMWIGTSCPLMKYDGNNWTMYTTWNSKLPGWVSALTIDNWGNKWIGTGQDGLAVFREEGVILTGLNQVNVEESNLSLFTLSQNYPNPFNPATEIAFSLPENSHITLTVFNALGQKVATLVDEKKGAGSYQVRWDGAGFPSGVYFYRLETQGFTKTIKMLLMK